MKEIKKWLAERIGKLGIKIEAEEIKLERPTDFCFGDWSSNIALILAKKEKTKPRELAEKIIGGENLPEGVEKVEAAGAGFINFYFKKEILVEEAEKNNYEVEFRKKLAKWGHEKGKQKTMVIDYSAPNIAKPFGIGHLRSTNIGQAIYNIYKILGWNCIGDNHLGDWGTQFGKMIVAIKHWADDKKIEKLKIEDLERLYVKFHVEAEKDEKLDEEAREWFLKLEKGDGEAREMWQKIVDLSLTEFGRIYEMLGVKIDVSHGESFYEPMLGEIIGQIKKAGISKKSQGAEIVEFAKMPPAMIEKSNGATTYFTRDLATIAYRIKEWQVDLMVYEVGVDQELHFRQLFEVARLMGWTKKCRLFHVAHGLIRWKDTKFSTRKGQTIHLEEVIEKAIEKAKVAAKKSRVVKKMKETERQKTIEAVAVGAIKLADLMSDPKKDVVFDWERVMSLEGNSGPYLQYTYARIGSVLKNSEIREQKNMEIYDESWEKEEEVLLRYLGRFEEKIVEAGERFSPAVLVEYLLNLARIYNEFYAKYQIIGEKEEVRRIFLSRTAGSVLETGLGLLGIEAIEEM